MTVFAHVRCTAPEAVTTLVVCAAVAALITRPWRESQVRRRRRRTVLAVVLAGGFAVTGCGGERTSSGSRPVTTARVRILSPTPNEVTATDLVVRIELVGGRVVRGSADGPLSPTRGHLHLTLDGRQVEPASSTRETLRDVSPGRHALEAEFVAEDHAPFANRPVAVVLFEVR